MKKQIEERTLTNWLSSPLLNLVSEEDSSGRLYTTVYDYFMVVSFVYECGAILGRVMRDKLYSLFKLFLSDEEYDAQYKAGIRYHGDNVQLRLGRYKRRFGREPHTFDSFFFERELMMATGLHPQDVADAYVRGDKNVIKPYRKKMHIKVAKDDCIEPADITVSNRMYLFNTEGVIFGSLFPELTERMNNNYWQLVKEDISRLSYLVSVLKESDEVVPETINIPSFEEQEKTILEHTADYVSSFYPKLLDPLGLSTYFQDKGTIAWQQWTEIRYDKWFELVKFIDEMTWLG